MSLAVMDVPSAFTSGPRRLGFPQTQGDATGWRRQHTRERPQPQYKRQTDNAAPLTAPYIFPRQENHPNVQRFAMQSEGCCTMVPISETRKLLILKGLRISKLLRISETRKLLILKGLRVFGWSRNSE